MLVGLRTTDSIGAYGLNGGIDETVPVWLSKNCDIPENDAGSCLYKKRGFINYHHPASTSYTIEDEHTVQESTNNIEKYTVRYKFRIFKYCTSKNIYLLPSILAFAPTKC